jgi:hypothetical protein
MRPEPIAFAELVDAMARLATLPPAAQEYWARRAELTEDEFWEFYGWLTERWQKAEPDPFGWDDEEIEEAVGGIRPGGGSEHPPRGVPGL